MAREPKSIVSAKATTARSCSAKKKPRNVPIVSTLSPNDPSVLPDVHGIQAVSEARTHQPHVVLWDLGRPGETALASAND
jgi:hypothetical protein